MTDKRAIVLLSGGLDSSTVLYYALNKGYKCHCLLFDYGQRHKKELNSAKKIAKAAGCNYNIIKLRLPETCSSLTDKKQEVPVHKILKFSKKLPTTYVPGRNTIFISFALSYAEILGAGNIFIGANAIDFSGYPDCRPEYYKAWNKVLNALGTHVEIQAPLLHLDKTEIIRLGASLGVPYELTWSCYAGLNNPCGKCDSCKFRAKGFKEAGIKDKALKSYETYQSSIK